MKNQNEHITLDDVGTSLGAASGKPQIWPEAVDTDMDSVATAQQSTLNDHRMNDSVIEEIVMESHGHKLWVTSRRRRSLDHKAMLKTISVFPLYPDCPLVSGV